MTETSIKSISNKLTDLDFAILSALPEEGSRFGNHTFAKQVTSLREEISDAKSSQINGRLRSLKHLDLVVGVVVQPVGDGVGWQRTSLGVQVLEHRRGATVPQNVIPLRAGNGGAN